MSRKIRVAVAGQPNCGKSTMFNMITGSTARVGNYPGITVDRLEGMYILDDYEISLVDLPGTYSLTAYSMEEVVARDVVVDERPDVVANIVDAGALERGLYLTVQLMEMGVPVVLGLNMMDEARKNGLSINSAELARRLEIPVVECIGRRGIGKDELMEGVVRVAGSATGDWKPLEISYGHDIDPVLEEMVAKIESQSFMTDRYTPRWLAIKYLEEDDVVIRQGRKAGRLGWELEEMVKKLTDHTRKTLNTYPEALLADYRYGYINAVLRGGILKRDTGLRLDVSNKIDKVVTQRFLGPLVMLGVLWAMFYVTFNVGAYPQAWMEAFFDWLGSLGTRVIPDGLLQSLVVSGIINGVGAVLSFTPLILIMFAMLVFLEDLGYMARVAYMMDRVFRAFGLHGSSVMPLIISGGIPGGCAVPGVMCARTLRSPRERLATIFTAPFMVCGAKTTAFIMLCAAFFPDNPTGTMFTLVLISWGGVLVVSRFLRWTVLKGPPSPFVMELPPYRLPTFRGVATHTWDRVWQYVKKAGTVIFAVSVLMWVIMTFPRPSETQQAEFDLRRGELEQKVKEISAARNLDGDQESLLRAGALAALQGREQMDALEGSVAGRLGAGLEPLTHLAGFPWEVNIAVIGAFAAKEVFVSTMATAYSMQGEDDDGETAYNPATVSVVKQIAAEEKIPIETFDATALSDRLAKDPAYTPPAVWAIMIFLLFYAPCMVTMVAILKESGIKWALLTLGGSLAMSFVAAVIVYQVGTYVF